GRVDVDGGEDALVRQLARQAQLAVAGALELLEDDLIHLRAGLYECGGEDREGSAVLDVARSAEEALRRVQCCRVHATGEHTPRGGGRDVVRAAETGDRVQQHDDVAAELHQSLGALDGELVDGGVVLG